MNLKPLIGIFNNWYNKLNSGERRLFFAFAAVLAVSFYLSVFLKPTLDEVSRLKKLRQENQNRLEMLNSQLPSAPKLEQEIGIIKQNLKNLKLNIYDAESKLINVSQEQQLLTELIKHAQGLAIDLESVKQDIKEEKEGFARIYIYLKFSSNYKKLVSYIRKIEGISPFVKIEEMELAQSKAEPLTAVEATIVLSAILSYESGNQGQLSLSAKEAAGEVVSLQRSPFTPRFTTEKTKRKNLKVTGITYRENAAGSTAIINGAILKIGDQIEGVKIESILPNSIIIDNGVEKETLKLER